MKVAYLGKIQLTDVDFSYLHSAQQKSDITYFMEVCPRFMTGPAFNIKRIYSKSGVFKAVDIYPEFAEYSECIDIDKFYVVNTSGKLWFIKAFWTNILLLFFLIRNKFGVIHVSWPLNVYEFVLYFLRGRMILTVHDPFPHSGLDTLIVRLRRKIAFGCIRKLIILNRKQRQKFIDFYHINPERIVDSMLSSYTYLQSVKPNYQCVCKHKRFILFFGKVSKYKGLDYLLPAMVKVHNKYPDIHLVVAGKGTYHFDISEYEKLEYIDIQNRFIDKEELVALVQKCYAVVCPYTDATQSGVLMSAFAFYKPAIATNVGALPEMLHHDEFGLIVKEKDIDALASSIIKICEEPSLVDTYSSNIRNEYLSGKSSWEQISAHLINEYKKINVYKN